MEWWIPGGIFVLLQTFTSTINQHIRIPGKILTFWRGFIPALLTPILLFTLPIELPTDPLFYIFSIIAGALTKYRDVIRFDLAKDRLVAPLSRIMSLKVWIVFILWTLHDDLYRAELFSKPDVLSGICLSILIAGYASFRIKKCDITLSVIARGWPVLVMASMIDILNKLSMDSSTFWGGVITYIFITNLVILFVSVPDMLKDKNIRAYFVPDFPVICTIFGIVTLLLLIAKCSSISLAENAAYVSILGYMTPVLVSIVNKFMHIEDKSDMRAGFLLVLSTVSLIYFTRL